MMINRNTTRIRRTKSRAAVRVCRTIQPRSDRVGRKNNLFFYIYFLFFRYTCTLCADTFLTVADLSFVSFGRVEKPKKKNVPKHTILVYGSTVTSSVGRAVYDVTRRPTRKNLSNKTDSPTLPRPPCPSKRLADDDGSRCALGLLFVLHRSIIIIPGIGIFDIFRRHYRGKQPIYRERYGVKISFGNRMQRKNCTLVWEK